MSYSRSPRALRSMTVGIKGTTGTLSLVVLRGRSVRQPFEHGRAREAPPFADSPAGKHPATRELLGHLRFDLERVGAVLEGQHVGLERPEGVATEDGGRLLVG